MNTGSYVNGKWYQPTGKEIGRNINPADIDDVIAEFPYATPVDVHKAIDAAQAAFTAWRKTPGPERGRVIWRAAEIARRRADEIARSVTTQAGARLNRTWMYEGPAALAFASSAGSDIQMNLWVRLTPTH